MIRGKKGSEKAGAIFPITKDRHRIKIFEVLRSHLHIFAVGFVNTPTTNVHRNVKSENYISRELSIFLNNHVTDTGYLFMFQEIGPDIFVREFGDGVHGKTLLFIEAKRLYQGARKDYVSSGIARFKKEDHGKEDNVAAMLGYVQDNDFDHWHDKVNSWIDDLRNDSSRNPEWKDQDKLTAVNIADIAEFTSRHSRIQEKPITLYHFWINLCN